ncbi:TRAP transporter small permease [Paracoccus sp. 1_MG-2023]|uniref:TRAP transporter small permease n=1 Tax=unclassified Paracoccus (in: a-proteobacteria) TaxID=2688777 RepID=UPI001C096151|nr:TRAP transporter small permease [Paracoccus sp. 1_MG-2023]MBU2957618.1 TRAP transporter small permease [Paracoccus sp. C2R09]MDO6667535.1 TRAP transporter small permease [Paracoccus sp. 1_MG-2023]
MSFWRIFDLVERTAALLALVGVVLAVLIAGVGRSLGWPVAAAPQYAQLALIWSCMLGADIAAREGQHIRVGAIFDALPPTLRRLLSGLILALILPFLAFVAWQGWFLAIDNWQRELGASGLSYGLVTLALPVGAVLLILSLVRRLMAEGLVGLFDQLAHLDVPPEDLAKEEIL